MGPVDRRLRHYRYVYASGHEGDICLTGFSPRSSALVVYLGPGIDNDKLMAKLGKHKHGKGCLYINKLDDVDRKVLRKLIEYSVKALRNVSRGKPSAEGATAPSGAKSLT